MNLLERPIYRGQLSNFFSKSIAAVALLLCFVSHPLAVAAPQQSLAAQVNPFIGTGADPDDGIDDFPGAVVPFGMVQLSPDTEDHGFGYHAIQTKIKGFSMTHMSGPGCANEGDVFFTATTGPIMAQVADYQSPYTHGMEKAEPGYYQVRLLQWDVNAELSATEHNGVARFTFPAGQQANIVLPLSHTLNLTEGAQIRIVGNRTIEGYVTNHVFCSNKQTYKVYFAMNFSRPFSSYGTWKGTADERYAKIDKDRTTATQNNPNESIGGYASWQASQQSQSITAKVGISYVDPAGAENNLRAEAETRDFDAVRNLATHAWEKELSTIEVSGGTTSERTVFYTALYHSLLMPSIFSDADGRYLGFDGQVHSIASGHHVYTNFSGWDIYRSEMPLLALIEPQRMEDMAESIVLMYRQGGWMPRWPQINHYTNDMTGSPLSIVLSTAWLNGLHDFDIDAAWEGMYKDATQAPAPGHPYQGEEGIEWINRLGYLPNDKIDFGSVAKTQEYALAYASLSRLAAALGKSDDEKLLMQRAFDERNVFNPATRYFQPRNADGTWLPDFYPSQYERGFVEGSGWHFQSFAPADLPWLINAVGREEFNKRMTEFFNYPVPGWYAQYFNPYNETDLQAPFVFNFSGQPWKAQRAVRRVLRENYTTATDGIPGNDDAGAMSSWAVLAMMGIYTVDPTSLAYELVGPTFPRVVIHLQAPYPGRTFTIDAPAARSNAPYIQKVTLNNHPHHENWISFGAITAGGAMQVVVGPEANEKWGAAPEDAPPSLTVTRPSANAHKQ